eukprot:714612-Rhodomonas_salina.1
MITLHALRVYSTLQTCKRANAHAWLRSRGLASLPQTPGPKHARNHCSALRTCRSLRVQKQAALLRRRGPSRSANVPLALQVTILGVIGLKEGVQSAPFMFPLIVVTALFWRYLRYLLAPPPKSKARAGNLGLKKGGGGFWIDCYPPTLSGTEAARGATQYLPIALHSADAMPGTDAAYGATSQQHFRVADMLPMRDAYLADRYPHLLSLDAILLLFLLLVPSLFLFLFLLL